METSKKEVIVDGKNIINQLSIVFKTGRLHNIENVEVIAAMEKLLNYINAYIEDEGSLNLELIGDCFYVNKNLVKYPLEFLLNIEFIAKEFKKRDLGSITFLSVVDIHDLKVLVKAFAQTAAANTVFDNMAPLLKDADSISIDKLKEIKEGTEAVDKRRHAKMMYFNAVSFSKGIMTRIRSGDKVSMRKAKRIVGTLLDAIIENESFLIGLTTIKDYDEYTYHHCVNVGILSIAMGRKIGLKRPELISLGLVALLHDIGKTGVPMEILNKPSSFTNEEWRVIQRHPYLGALSILKLKGIDSASIQAAIVAFQHHMNFDLSGYPKMREPMPLDFWSRIVGISDQYDAMTSSRVYARAPYAPDKALSIMMERSGTQLDPVLFKFFVNMIGIYPIGALVILDNKEMGLVYECNHLVSERPRVMIIVDSSGNKVDGTVVDLAEKDDTGACMRNIVSTVDPNKYKINLAEYLL